MLVPAELIDHIFSFLDTPALKACSKAHPFYSKLAERHIYADLVVHLTVVSELYKVLSENPRFLDYPRSLDLRRHGLLIMPMIPRMANLTSLRIDGLPCLYDQYADFISTFTICLQQSSIEELYLSHLYGLPLSVLDSGKNIKKLALSDCSAKEGELIPSSPSLQSLQTLILDGENDVDLHIWVVARITHLTSLGLRKLDLDQDSSVFPELLRACSNSLTRLHLDLGSNCKSIYSYDADHHSFDHWSDGHDTLPFTLAALAHLKNLSIDALIASNATRIECALPEIIRLIQTAPNTIQHFVLYFHWYISDCMSSLSRLDWSLLDRLQSSHSARTRPRIDLYVTSEDIMGPEYSPECILEALAGCKILMDLVKQGSVNLKSGFPLVSWEWG